MPKHAQAPTLGSDLTRRGSATNREENRVSNDAGTGRDRADEQPNSNLQQERRWLREEGKR